MHPILHWHAGCFKNKKKFMAKNDKYNKFAYKKSVGRGEEVRGKIVVVTELVVVTREKGRGKKRQMESLQIERDP